MYPCKASQLDEAGMSTFTYREVNTSAQIIKLYMARVYLSLKPMFLIYIIIYCNHNEINQTEIKKLKRAN